MKVLFAAIYDGKEMKTFTYSRSSFYFIDKPSNIIGEGYPLDSISIIPKFNKYLSELSEDEKNIYKQQNDNNKIFEFMINNI